MTEIPKHCLEWLVESRRRYLKKLMRGEPLTYFSAHLPVVATWSGDGEFPVNMTAKGIGLLPRSDLLTQFIELFEETLDRVRDMRWSESWSIRVDTLFRLYGDVANFDPRLLGGLEIFEGRTLENLRRIPRASLLYAGIKEEEGKVGYISFQINAEVEIVGKENSYYRFLLLGRKLFEFDKFHLYQPDYPYGYIFRVKEVRDKSPWSRAGSRS